MNYLKLKELGLKKLRQVLPLDCLYSVPTVRPGFKLTSENAVTIAQICNKLDGLPLAIELAAARLQVLSPQKLLERLNLKLLTGGSRNLPERQQTLCKTIDWSYEFLEESEKQLFTRLAVFGGGCSLKAAEAICDFDGKLEITVLDGISSLLTKSLIKQVEDEIGEMRYSMLQTIREYALEQLEASGLAQELRQQHESYFLAQAEQTEKKLSSAEQRAALNLLETEYDNLRTALNCAIERKATDTALKLTGALGRFWQIRG